MGDHTVHENFSFTKSLKTNHQTIESHLLPEEYIKLSINHYLILEIMKLSPILIVIIFFWWDHNALLTIAFFQIITLILMPCFFIDIICPNYETNITSYRFEYFLSGITKDLARQITIGLFWFFTILCLGLIGFYYSYHFMPGFIENIKIPLKYDFFSMSYLVIFLGFTNPLLEEWFWRCFLLKFYSKNEKNNLFLTFGYAFYHFFVVWELTDYIFGFISVFSIFIMGRFFLFLNTKKGFFAAVIAHLASDLIVVFAAIVLLQERNN